MATYTLLNKPYKVLTQFTDESGRQTLSDYVKTPDIYSAGRLDYDSEGLLLLTDDGQLIHQMMNPQFKVPKTYLAQVEGIPTQENITQMRQGLRLKDGLTKPCLVDITQEPQWLWTRVPPIRERQNIPTSWLRITITEGKNRQVRRMTAAIGHPTLRLVREKIGNLSVEQIGLGQTLQIDINTIIDNGINYKDKKRGQKTSPYQRQSKTLKPPGRHPRRNQQRQNQNQTSGKTRPGSR